MAPTYTEIIPLRNALSKLEREIEEIKEIKDLMDCKDRYLAISKQLFNFINEYQLGLKLVSDSIDKVFQWEGGAGYYWGDSRSTELAEILKEEIKSKKIILADIAKLVPEKLIMKKDGIFYYRDKPIIIGEKTQAYNLLDVLYTLGNHEGFCSYEKIIEEFRKRQKEKLITTEKEIDSWIAHDIQNIRDQLFKTAKVGVDRLKNETPNGLLLIELVRGDGFKLNNISS